jgi:hypothetical protein
MSGGGPGAQPRRKARTDWLVGVLLLGDPGCCTPLTQGIAHVGPSIGAGPAKTERFHERLVECFPCSF